MSLCLFHSALFTQALTHEEFLTCHFAVEPKPTYQLGVEFLYHQAQSGFLVRQELMGAIEDICSRADDFNGWLEQQVTGPSTS
jgi:hypothetical protein